MTPPPLAGAGLVRATPRSNRVAYQAQGSRQRGQRSESSMRVTNQCRGTTGLRLAETSGSVGGAAVRDY